MEIRRPEQPSDVTRLLDFGNGTLVFTRVGVNYGDVWCHAKLLNGRPFSRGAFLFVPFYPSRLLAGIWRLGRFQTPFRMAGLKPAMRLSCTAVANAMLIRIGLLEFSQQSAGRSKKVTRLCESDLECSSFCPRNALALTGTTAGLTWDTWAVSTRTTGCSVERATEPSAVLPEPRKLRRCARLCCAHPALCSDKPCRQHCLLVRDHVCSSEVKLLRASRLRALSGRRLRALSTPASNLEAVMLRHARPASGVQSGCAKWSSAANRLLSADYFTSLQDAGSECRNPGAQFPRPSCVDKSDTRFFITCPVLECPEDQLPLGLSA
uniref:DUF4338 domain-containing protein n=1 Tax=Macrostomum lignano TaxID=282301 RepID=A0A1I8FFF1_9PLAT